MDNSIENYMRYPADHAANPCRRPTDLRKFCDDPKWYVLNVAQEPFNERVYGVERVAAHDQRESADERRPHEGVQFAMHGVGMEIQVPCGFEVDNYLGQCEDPEAEVPARHHFYHDGGAHVERRHRHEFFTLPLPSCLRLSGSAAGASDASVVERILFAASAYPGRCNRKLDSSIVLMCPSQTPRSLEAREGGAAPATQPRWRSTRRTMTAPRRMRRPLRPAPSVG